MMARLARILLPWLALWLLAPATLEAQDRPASAQAAPKKGARKSGGKAAKASKAAKPAKEQSEPRPAEAPASSEAKAAAKPAPAPVAEGDVHKEGATDVKVLEFSGLDIEGQLKTPQMLYFLRRLRAEFGRPNLPHRSFLPELDQTTKDEAF